MSLINLEGEQNSSVVLSEFQAEPGKFLSLLATIPVEWVTKDRNFQAGLHYIMSFYSNCDKKVVKDFGGFNFFNTNPVISVESENGGTNYYYNSFKLLDSDHLYYFPQWQPGGDQTPDFLREEDIVPSRMNSQTFPEPVREMLKDKLGIVEDEMLEWLIYNQDSRVTEDAVLVDIPFNKPFLRVPVQGGKEQLFNYNIGENGDWEATGGVYSPKKSNRFLKGKVFRKFIK